MTMAENRQSTALPEASPTEASGSEADTRPAFGNRIVEIVVSAGIIAFGALVMFDSVRLGWGWADDGPQSGYFPFYIGLFLVVSSGVTLAQAVFMRGGAYAETFVERGQLKLVLAVLIPSMFYVWVMQWLGMYAASAVFIGFFMRWLGKYGWTKTVVVSVAVIVAFYFMFEIWFLVPLPKGPIEDMLGLG